MRAFAGALLITRFNALEFHVRTTFNCHSRFKTIPSHVAGLMEAGFSGRDSKICLTCGKQFSWHKKWDQNWHSVTTCSNKCKKKLRASNSEVSVLKQPSELHHSYQRGTTPKTENAPRQKSCDVCGKVVVLAYRCRWDKTKKWRFVCRPCWPSISGQGYLENAGKRAREGGASTNSNLGNPLYQYGGTWKVAIGLKQSELNTLQHENLCNTDGGGSEDDTNLHQ